MPTPAEPTEYEIARERVENDLGLMEYIDVILDTSWGEADHWRWVADADRAELLSWAREIARNSEEA